MSTSAGSVLRVDADPAEMGVDPARLERLDRHFRRYVDDGRLPGWLVAVVRHGRVVHLQTAGRRDIEADLPVETDTLWRIYSMTKPITSVAAMMLWEEGAFELKDPVARFIPSFADTRVWNGGNALKPVTVPQVEPMRIWHLLTHTAGLTYGFHHAHSVDRLYREAGFEWGAPAGLDLEGVCDVWAGMPLLFQPGSEWNYSVATDVLGRVVEVASGQSLDTFFAERILGPLGMHDTSFALRDGRRRAPRRALLARPGDRDGGAQRGARAGGVRAARVPLRRRRPALHRARLPALHADAARGRRAGRRAAARAPHRGVHGSQPPARRRRTSRRSGVSSSPRARSTASASASGSASWWTPRRARCRARLGELAWGGAASTAFYLDPLEDLGAIFLTQLLPSSAHAGIRPQLRQLVAQALVD